ncbi:MAG: serine/threonine protein kinase [Alphaproteobacteria bacterium]|nr:serine/threonine protein kinase [Alphaproteobacteria bacterium]
MTEGNGRVIHLLGCLGRGGFGEVYRARVERPSGLSTLAALKVLHAEVDPRSQAGRRLQDEARLLGLIRHRAIPQVLDVLEVEGRLGLLVELVEGIDLSRALRGPEPPGPRAVLEALATVADALHAAWSTPLPDGSGRTGIVHRDLKPANIRLARDGAARLLDFGIAWSDAVARAAITQTSALVGSPAYMAPERFDGASPTPANDIFGLGAVLYEGLTGQRLFADLSFKDLASITLFEDRYARAVEERLVEVRRVHGRPLEQLVATLLAWSPHARPPAEDAARLLESTAAALPGPALPAWCRAHPWHLQRDKDGPWVGWDLLETRPGVLVARLDPHADDGPVTTPSVAEPPLVLSEELEPVTTSLELEPLGPPGSASRRGPGVAWGVLGLLAAAGWALAVILAPRPEPASPVVAVTPPPAVAPAEVDEVREPQPTPAEEPEVLAAVRTPPPSRRPRDRAPATPPPAVEPVVVPRLAPAPLPEPAALQEPAALPQAAAVAPDPAPRRASAPAPEPVGPLVRVASDLGEVQVALSDGVRTTPLPARVAPGSYTILATESGITRPEGKVEVGSQDLVVRCVHGFCRGVPP